MLDTMRPSQAVWALSSLLIAACMNGSEAPDVSSNDEALKRPPVAWETFEDPKGTEAAGLAPTARLIRNENGYRRLFGHGSPGIDWDDEVVLFYSAGQKNTGGYRAEITSVDKRGQRLTVTTTLVSPGPNCVVTEAFTTPSVLARVHGADRVRKARFEHIDQLENCETGTPCGGIAGIECPGAGICDQDDPNDDCDPERGADCAGLCSCPVLALCIPGLIFDSSPAVCACVPDPSSDPCAAVRCKDGSHCEASNGSAACVPNEPDVFCGGIAGIECPGLGWCEDSPDDGCSPESGGADCGGYCTCTALAKCIEGYIFDASPRVCGCVKPMEDPCALVDCRSGAICIVQNGEPVCVSNGSWECGPSLCGAGTVCCNESCGVCTPPDGACTQQACVP